MSLDGFIADEHGGYEWITGGSGIDFSAYLTKIDALVMGRGTWEVMQTAGGPGFGPEIRTYVVSTTLDPAEHPDVTVVSGDVEAFVADLKQQDGKDIWLFGGGVLFRGLLEAGLVDRVEVGVVPVLLGAGIPLLPGFDGAKAVAAKRGSRPGGPGWVGLRLHSMEDAGEGLLLLKYDVDNAATTAKKPRAKAGKARKRKSSRRKAG